MSSRALFWIFCAALLAFASRDRALALEGSKVTAIGSNPVVVRTEGRKGTRIYTPDPSEDGLEKATSSPEQTKKEKLDQCMASWDTKTHITKANWQQICQRELSNGGL